MGCEECGNDEATTWVCELAVCSDCAELLSELDKAASA